MIDVGDNLVEIGGSRKMPYIQRSLIDAVVLIDPFLFPFGSDCFRQSAVGDYSPAPRLNELAAEHHDRPDEQQQYNGYHCSDDILEREERSIHI